MASRVVYIERSQRGSHLTGLRLVTPRSDESWAAPALSPDGEDAGVNAAAAWIAARLAPAGKVGMFVLDADGSVCSWATVPGTEPSVVDAVVRQQSGGMGESKTVDGSDGASGNDRADVIWYYAPGAADSTIQPLSSTRLDPDSDLDGRRRAAVLAVGDGIGRVLVDQIDRLGVGCGPSCSIWHAMAASWDPSGQWRQPAKSSSDHVVAESAAGITAVIVVEPTGRLLWAWSRQGKLLAAGSLRLPVRRTGEAENESDAPQLPRESAARLASDWLAWSAQLALAPDRVVMLAPSVAEAPGEHSLGAGGFGRSVAASWSGAAVDLVLHDDPIGATLTRLAEIIDERDGVISAEESLDPARSLVNLTVRPGASHRRLYVWSSLAVTAGAVVVGALAWGLRLQASGLSSLARQVDMSWQATFKDVKLPRPPMPGMESMDLRAEVDRVKRESMPIAGVEQARPIVREFETLSNVLALPDFELISMSLDSQRGVVSIQVNAPDLASAEALSDALGRIAGSDVSSWTFIPGSRPPGSDKVPCTYTGVLGPSGTPAAGGSS